MPIFAFSHRRAQEQYAVRRFVESLAQFSDSPPHTRFIESPARPSQVRMIPPRQSRKNPPHESRIPIVRPGRRDEGDFYFEIGSGSTRRQSSPEIGHAAKHAVRGDRPGQTVHPAASDKPTGRSARYISRRRSRTRIRSPRSRYRRFRTRRSSARFPRLQEPKTAR